jgi:hypothetical protein
MCRSGEGYMGAKLFYKLNVYMEGYTVTRNYVGLWKE